MGGTSQPAEGSQGIRKPSVSPDPVKSVQRLGFPYQTADPFLFCVYHKDYYPEGDEHMQAPRSGNGMDFDPSQPYRMYHGKRVPGFPQHPHRGFETLTATMEGYTDHSDSMGCAGRYGMGDLQWMTAGKGIVHGEMFPLVHKDKPNTLRLFQIWLNLPAKKKMVDPAFAMHWAEDIPKVEADDGKVKVTVWAGELMGKKALKYVVHANSASADTAFIHRDHLQVWLIEMQPGGKFVVPPAARGKEASRNFYFHEGGGLQVAGRDVPLNHKVEVAAEQEVELFNASSTAPSSILMLQGKPIGEPVVKHGPFVMNTHEEIAAAFEEYRLTQFGGWPWDENAPIFPRDKGRFALSGGKEDHPPGQGS